MVGIKVSSGDVIFVSECISPEIKWNHYGWQKIQAAVLKITNKQTTENKAWNNHEIRMMVEWVDMDFSDGFHIPCFTLWCMHTSLLKIHILFLLWEFPTHLYKWLRPPEYLRHSARLSIIYHCSSYATSKLQRLPCHRKSISSLRSWARLFP